MPNAWIEHVKQWSKANNVSYGCAISLPECKEAYRKNRNDETREILKKRDGLRNFFANKTKKTTKQEQKEQPKVSGKVTQAQIDKMKKEIDTLVDKAGKIAEREGKVTAEVSKLLEKKNNLMMERLKMIRLLKQQQKS